MGAWKNGIPTKRAWYAPLKGLRSFAMAGLFGFQFPFLNTWEAYFKLMLIGGHSIDCWEVTLSGISINSASFLRDG